MKLSKWILKALVFVLFALPANGDEEANKKQKEAIQADVISIFVQAARDLRSDLKKFVESGNAIESASVNQDRTQYGFVTRNFTVISPSKRITKPYEAAIGGEVWNISVTRGKFKTDTTLKTERAAVLRGLKPAVNAETLGALNALLLAAKSEEAEGERFTEFVDSGNVITTVTAEKQGSNVVRYSLMNREFKVVTDGDGKKFESELGGSNWILDMTVKTFKSRCTVKTHQFALLRGK